MPLTRWWKKIGCVSAGWTPRGERCPFPRFRGRSSCPRPRQTPSPDRRHSVRVRYGYSYRCCCCRSRPAQLLRDEVQLVRGLGATEHPKRLRAMPIDGLAQSPGRAVEGLVPARPAQRVPSRTNGFLSLAYRPALVLVFIVIDAGWKNIR